MLYGCVHIPNFSCQAAVRVDPLLGDNAVAVIAGSPPLVRVIAINAMARKLGLEIGMTKTEAESCSGLLIRERSLALEASAHAALVDCVARFSPLCEDVSIDTVVLDSNCDGRLADPTRVIHMLDLVTEKAGWGKPLGPHRGRGISCFYSKTTYLAQVAEVTVKYGNLHVDRVVTVADPGRVINRNGIRAQIEGGVLMGLSAALKERITVKDGMIQQQNFNSYDLLRMPDAPQLETYLVEGGRPPGGIGEPPLALIGPSVDNAIFAATGKRLRKLTFQLDEASS
jgi:hypothetical protein